MNLLTFAIGALTLCLQFLSFYKTCHQTTNLEKFKFLVAPIFVALEPTLYKSINSFDLAKISSEIDSILKLNNVFSDWKISDSFRFLNDNPSQRSYNRFCRTVEFEYDNLSRKIGLKTRSLSYRINNNQFSSKTELIILLSVYSVPYISLLFVSLITIVSGLSIVLQYLPS